MKFGIGNIVKFGPKYGDVNQRYIITNYDKTYYFIRNMKTGRSGKWIIKNNDRKLINAGDGNDILKGML